MILKNCIELKINKSKQPIDKTCVHQNLILNDIIYINQTLNIWTITYLLVNMHGKLFSHLTFFRITDEHQNLEDDQLIEYKIENSLKPILHHPYISTGTN